MKGEVELMKVKELKVIIDKMIKEGKGDYMVSSYNGDYNYSSYGKKGQRYLDEANVEIKDELKYLDISVGD